MRILALFIGLINDIRIHLLLVYRKFKVKSICGSYQDPFYVGLNCHVTKNTHIGRNVSLNGVLIEGEGKVVIGDNCQIAADCCMISQNHNYHGDALPFDDTCILKDIIIEDNVWIGRRVLIVGGVMIGEGAIIQAGSVVVTSIPKYAIAGGAPAKVFSKRNEAHYLQLKREKKYFRRCSKFRPVQVAPKQTD